MTHAIKRILTPPKQPQGPPSPNVEIHERRPQCEAQRLYSYCKAWEAGHPDKRCKQPGAYRINGRVRCARHAGIEALHILIEGR